MKKTIKKLVAAATIFIAAGLITGCEGQNPSNTKKARLVAAENIQLKKDIAQRDKEIEKQKELLAKCEQEKAAFIEQTEKDIGDLSSSTTSLDDFEKIIKLEEENNILKTQIEDLKEELQKIKEQLAVRP